MEWLDTSEYKDKLFTNSAKKKYIYVFFAYWSLYIYNMYIVYTYAAYGQFIFDPIKKKFVDFFLYCVSKK